MIFEHDDLKDEIDLLIHRDIFRRTDLPIPKYSSDISAAWTIRNRMKELGWDSQDYLTEDGGIVHSYSFWFICWRDEHGNYCGSPTKEYVEVKSLDDAPLAICRAALDAIEIRARSIAQPS